MTLMALLTGEQDADLLKNISKQDILTLFLSRIHPSSTTRSKLSVHLRSQKPPPQKLSAAAVEAFEASLGKPELRGSWKEELGDDSTPYLDQFESYWKAQGVDSVLLASIPDLAKKYPLEDKVLPREGVEYIDDVKAFKKFLQVSEETGPSVEWGDIPLSKY
jgi:insulysin